MKDSNNIQTAEVVLACSDLDETLAFFVETLQFQIDRIFPADAPTVAVLSGYGIRLRLDRHATSKPATLRLYCSAPTALAQGNLRLQAPNGTEIELEAAENVLQLPPVVQSLVVSRLDSSTAWGVGRAGMRYRDLIPDRQGGRFIASHIHIPDAGPVPDYVHYHRIRFQLIFCSLGFLVAPIIKTIVCFIKTQVMRIDMATEFRVCTIPTNITIECHLSTYFSKHNPA